MRSKLILLIAILSACSIEEQRSREYGIEYNCEQSHNTMFFTFDNGVNSRRIMAPITVEWGTRTPSNNETHVTINDTVSALSSFFRMDNRFYRLDLFFYPSDEGNCSGIKADGVLVEAYYDENNTLRNRFYPLDCDQPTQLILMNNDRERKSICGRFAFTVRVQNMIYSISNGYFNVRIGDY